MRTASPIWLSSSSHWHLRRLNPLAPTYTALAPFLKTPSTNSRLPPGANSSLIMILPHLPEPFPSVPRRCESSYASACGNPQVWWVPAPRLLTVDAVLGGRHLQSIIRLDFS